MGQKLPFKRNYRCSISNTYIGNYILHPDYAVNPEHYIRAYLLIQKDLLNLFDFIEPSDTNQMTYSFRIHELLIRTCVEIEANFKAILRENEYKTKYQDWSIKDYKKLNASHRLSSYIVKLPYWKGEDLLRIPFESFGSGKTPAWYDAYNDVKHDRSVKFETASFQNLIDAICGLVVLLSSQFHTEDFVISEGLRSYGGPGDGYDSAIGEYFRIKFPTDWPDEEKYDFDWSQITEQDKKFNKLFEKL
ncbi:MAG: hypothetical protein CVU48_06645 [Candidatus Cloacimonetes bacterium HGW-Cloacimonetes-1]|jgi:hypothetical protein|nr:MAG: hypothetical protein CVU48_06645 [Candidatus Cloacimonetes bacterium HGW-Cloacimonetes-1]